MTDVLRTVIRCCVSGDQNGLKADLQGCSERIWGPYDCKAGLLRIFCNPSKVRFVSPILTEARVIQEVSQKVVRPITCTVLILK